MGGRGSQQCNTVPMTRRVPKSGEDGTQASNVGALLSLVGDRVRSVGGDIHGRLIKLERNKKKSWVREIWWWRVECMQPKV